MDGLTMQTGEGTASFRDAAGKNIFALDSLFAIDSNGVQTEALSYTFTPFKDTGKMIVTVTGARLDVQKSSGATPTIKAYRCTGSWSSSTITWNNKPAFTTTAASHTCTPYSTGSTWFCMDVTSIVQLWVNGTANYGFVLTDNVESDSNHWTLFYSSDAVSPHKPELYITYNTSTNPPVTPPVTPTTPSVDLMLQYDGAYILRYSDAYSRILRQANAVKNLYQSRFGITVNVGVPLPYTSYADECTTSYNQRCAHAGDMSCANSTSSGLQNYHHNNIHNICLRIPVPTNTTSVSMTFIGHLICEQSDYYGWHQNDPYKGLAYPARDIMTVHNFEGEASEKITAIHEFGHMFGIIDHYNKGCWSTEQIKIELNDKKYNSECIYGEDREQPNVINDTIICQGCINRINENKNKYSN